MSDSSWFDDRECIVCEKSIADNEGLQVQQVSSTWVGKSGNTFFSIDTLRFCSYRCLFKWTWDQIIPKYLYYLPGEAPKSVMKLATALSFKEIEEMKKDLLQYIEVLGELRDR